MYRGFLDRKKRTVDYQDNSSGKGTTREEAGTSAKDSKLTTEALPDQTCKFCYEPFETGDNVFKCSKCGTYYHYPLCLKSLAGCRVCGEKIVEKGNIVILVNYLHAVCPKCKKKIKLAFSLDQKIEVKCLSCGNEGKIPNPYLKAMKSESKTKGELPDELDVDTALLEKGAKSEVITPDSVKKRKPKLVIMDESITCHVCLGAIKTGLPVVVCKCGKKYHESCANRIGICPICDGDLADYEPVNEEVRKRSEKFKKDYVESTPATGTEPSQEPGHEPEPAAIEPESTPEPAAASESEPEPTTAEPASGPLAELDSNFSFDSYTVNDQNRIIHSIAHGIAEAPGNEYKLLFMHGEKGYGKTHLLQAIGNHVQNSNSDLKVMYSPTNYLFSLLDQALTEGNQKELEDAFKNADIILLDDFHEVPKNVDGQEMISKLFNYMLQKNKQIVIASEKPIEEIETLDDELAKIFLDGLYLRLNAPSPNLRQEILRKHVSHESAKLFDELMKSAEIKDNIDLGSLKKKLSQLILPSKKNN